MKKYIELLSCIWNILPIHRFFMGERQNIMQRKYKYNSERKRKRCWHGSIPKNSKDYVCVHFRGAFEWNKSLINVAKCYADCITKCVAAYGIVCFSFLPDYINSTVLKNNRYLYVKFSNILYHLLPLIQREFLYVL